MAIVLLAIFVVGTVQFFASATNRVMDSETRSLLHQIATEEIENIRALPYEKIGTVDGPVSGDLLDVESKTVEGVPVEITREVVFVTDPSYDGPYPANYRRVTVIVKATDSEGLDPMQLSSIIAGGATGGTLDITVTDTAGGPVPDVRLRIENEHLVPNVNIYSSAVRTDSQGHLLVSGRDPDSTNSYYLTATKTGYDSAATPEGLVLMTGTPYTVVQLIIDRLSTLSVHLTDGAGYPRSGVSLTVSGSLSIEPWTFSQTVTTDENGYATFPSIRYATSLQPHIVQTAGTLDPLLTVTAGTDPDPVDPSVTLQPGQVGVILDAGTTRTIELELPIT